ASLDRATTRGVNGTVARIDFGDLVRRHSARLLLEVGEQSVSLEYFQFGRMRHLIDFRYGCGGLGTRAIQQFDYRINILSNGERTTWLYTRKSVVNDSRP